MDGTHICARTAMVRSKLRLHVRNSSMPSVSTNVWSALFVDIEDLFELWHGRSQEGPFIVMRAVTNRRPSNYALERSVKSLAVGAAGASEILAPAAPGNCRRAATQRGR